MSVANALTLARMPAQTATADTSVVADTSTADTDFASLLLGQLAVSVALPPDLRRDSGLPPDQDNSASAGSLQDPSLLLAALAFAPAKVDSFIGGVQVSDIPLSRNEASSPIGWDGYPIGVESGSTGKPAKIAGNILTPSQIEVPIFQPLVDPATIGKSLPGDSIAPEGVLIDATSFKESATVKLPVADTGVPEVAPRNAAATKDSTMALSVSVGPAALKSAANEISVTEISSISLPTSSVQNISNPGNAATTIPTPLKLETSFHNPAWANDFSQKVIWMASNDKQIAQLILNPPDMGQIEISLRLNKDSASAFFVSPSAEVREAIETAMPRLKEMLAGVGIELGQSNVSGESFRQQAGNEEARQGSPRWMVDNAILGEDSAGKRSGQTIPARRGDGLVDTFA